MTFFKKSFIPFLLAIIALLAFSSCEEEGVSSGTQMEVKFTDAPVDDANIKGVFVTVAAVKVDGQMYEGLDSRQTIDIYAYQNGQVKSFGIADLDAKTYSQLSMSLDLETDASGNAPGCYILTETGEKIDLASSFAKNSIDLVANGAFEVKENAKSSVVMDFDLRKAIKYNQSGSNSFAFVSEAELQAAVRAVAEDQAGSIRGEFEANSHASAEDKVIVYAYKKGTFSQQSESQAQNDGKAAFRNAVTSTLATESNGQYAYRLSFLEAGEYDLVLATYKDNDQNGTFEFEGFLQTSLSVTGSVTNAATVSAGAELSLNLSIVGMIN